MTDGTELTYFWMPHRHRDLFSALDLAEDDRVDAGLDANIFFDLDDPSRNGAEESQGLQSDWLRSGSAVPHRRYSQRDSSTSGSLFERSDWHAPPDTTSVSVRWTTTRRLKLRSRRSWVNPDAADTSDIRHLARAIAAQATSFVMGDGGILSHSDEFYSRYGLSVLRPAELIGRLEELRNERLYQRDAFRDQASGKRRQSYAADYARMFRTSEEEKKTKEIGQKLRSYAADRVQIRVLPDRGRKAPGAQGALVLYVVERRAPFVAAIPFFRFSLPALAVLEPAGSAPHAPL